MLTKVMIVDDEMIICRLIEKLIDRETLDIDICPSFTSTLDAFDYAVRERPQIIITDINMPVMDGLELIRRLTEAGVNAHFIIISGYQSFDYAYTAIKYGVAHFILKPIDRDELNGALRGILGKIATDEDIRKRIKEADQSVSRSRMSMRKQILENLSLRTAGWQSIDLREYYDLKQDALRIGILQTDLTSGAKQLAEQLLPKLWERVQVVLKPLCCEMECAFEPSSFVFLTNYPSAREDEFMQRMTSALNDVLSMSRDYRLSVVVALSSPFEDLQSMAAAYRQAYYASQSRFVLGTNRILKASDIDFSPKYFVGFEKYRASLLHSIEIMDSALFDNAMNALIADLHEYLGHYPYQTYALYVQMLRDIDTIFMALQSGAKDDAGSAFRRHYKNCIMLRDFDRVLLETTQGMFKSFANESRTSQNTSIMIVKRYIDEHYAEPLSLEQLAGVIYLNPAYLGILFKKCEGISFMDYLTKLRFDKAKYMLCNTDLPIAEIAGKVGYKDVRYFTKQFLSKVGIKPTEYRRIHSD